MTVQEQDWWRLDNAAIAVQCPLDGTLENRESGFAGIGMTLTKLRINYTISIFSSILALNLVSKNMKWARQHVSSVVCLSSTSARHSLHTHHRNTKAADDNRILLHPMYVHP